MKQPSVKINYVYRLIYDALTVITPFITTPYISRIFGADGIGIYSFSSSVVTYFVLVAGLGTYNYGIKEIAQHRDNKEEVSVLFWEIELLSVFSSIISLICWTLYIIFFSNGSYYYIVLSPLILSSMLDISWFFTGYEKIRFVVIRNILSKITGIVLMFVLVHDKNDLLLYMGINSGVALLSNISMWTYVPQMISRVEFCKLNIFRHLKESMIFFIPTIATSIYTVLDKTLIGALTESNYENGYYEQASKIINLIKTLVFSSISFVMGARISYLFAQKKYDEIKERICKSISFIFFLGYGSMFGLVAVAKKFVPVFFGEGYEPVIKLIYFMSPLIIIIGISNCLGTHYYTPSGKRKKSAIYVVVGAMSNLIFNILFIPRWGAVGATVGSIIAESIISFLYVMNDSNYLSVKTLLKESYKRIIAGIIMMYIVRIIGAYMQTKVEVTLLVQIGIGAITYVFILFLLRDTIIIYGINIIKFHLKNKGILK